MSEGEEPPLWLEIVPVGEVRPSLYASLIPELDRRFGTCSATAEPLQVAPEWWDEPGGQLHSGAIVDSLIERMEGRGHTPGDYWSLALTEHDLCAPGLEWVFGEATVGGCCAVVSLFRLRPRAGEDPRLLERRLLVEAVHELGHVAGLEHCPRPDCVMFASVHVEDSDRKGDAPCPGCREHLRTLLVAREP